ncbi:hypothetical protein, partial [Nocardioides sp.]|uniref:hypothetical protein n=1 Tax=Nocardioides sp. TaxID=35761 RepID=UPI00286BB819
MARSATHDPAPSRPGCAGWSGRVSLAALERWLGHTTASRRSPVVAPRLQHCADSAYAEQHCADSAYAEQHRAQSTVSR